MTCAWQGSRQRQCREFLTNGLYFFLWNIRTNACTAFIFHLDREVEKVNNFFLYKRSELERRLRILSEKSRRINPTSTLSGSAPSTTPVPGTPPVVVNGTAVAKTRFDLSIVTSPNGSAPASAGPSTGGALIVPPSPFVSDPEADAECLQALIETKERLQKLSWFAEMNRRAVQKILKK